MQRIKDNFLTTLDVAVGLSGKEILEVGSGDGARSYAIAQKCKHLTGVEPDQAKVMMARERNISNASFIEGKAENIPLQNQHFDVVLFTLSLHHVPVQAMNQAIDEAVRLVATDGFIVFLEPGTEGSFFEAEIAFDACDGDEREEKAAAYRAMTAHRGLVSVSEIPDETIFVFDSDEDFVGSMTPKKELAGIGEFLRRHNYTLNAERRINVFRVL